MPYSCSLAALQPKLADFGFLRELDDSTMYAIQVVGTPEFVDPAYMRTRFATTSADVYRYDPRACDLGLSMSRLSWLRIQGVSTQGHTLL